MDNLRKIREEKNLTQENLSTKLGITQKSISLYENGEAAPSIETFIKLCDILNVSADYLLDRTDIRYTAKEVTNLSLSSEELEHIEYFRKLSPMKKVKALGLVIGMTE